MWKSLFYFIIFSLLITSFIKFIDKFDHYPLSEGVQISLAMKGDLMVQSGAVVLYKSKLDYANDNPLFTCELTDSNKHCFFYGPKDSFRALVATLRIKKGSLNISNKFYSVDGLLIHSNSFNALSKSYKLRKKKGAGDLYRAVFTFWNDVVFRAQDSNEIWTNSFDMLVWFSEDDYAPMNIAWPAIFNLALNMSDRTGLTLAALLPLALQDLSDSKIDGLYFGKNIDGWKLTVNDHKKVYSYYTRWAKKHKKAYDEAVKGIQKLRGIK